MKVAIVTNYWRGSQGGGIRVYLENLVRELDARGADVRVIFREGQDPDAVCIPASQRVFAVRSLSALRRTTGPTSSAYTAAGTASFRRSPTNSSTAAPSSRRSIPNRKRR